MGDLRGFGLDRLQGALGLIGILGSPGGFGGGGGGTGLGCERLRAL